MGFIGIFLLLFISLPSNARYAAHELKDIPLDRLIANLQKKSKNEPRNYLPHFQLGRLYSMAYSTGKADHDVVPSSEGEPWFGYNPKPIPFEKNPAKLSKKYLNRALSEYRMAYALKKDDSLVEFGLAWCLMEAGEKNEATERFRKIFAINSAEELKLDYTFEWSLADEAGSYLLSILDPKKDKREIEEVKKVRLKIQKLSRTVTPIIIPVGDEVALDKLTENARYINFDLDGSGVQRPWKWINARAGWLVYRSKGKSITSGIQMFGNVSFWIFWKNGYEALSSLDDNADGFLTGSELKNLAIWNDKNSNGVSETGEVRSLDKYKIIKLDTNPKQHSSGILYSPHGVIYSDGTYRPSYDWVSETEK